MNICHMTSAHPRYDTRIFVKQCCSLANDGNSVSLVVADGKGDETIENISIYDVGIQRGRLNRILKSSKSVYLKGRLLDADVYHLHDPELIPYGLKLKKSGKIVIFDAHEDLPKQILGKPYMKKWQSKPISWIAKHYEKRMLSKFSGIVAATPYIRDKFKKINSNTVDINNYPKLEEFSFSSGKRSSSICYIGGLSRARGIGEIVSAIGLTKTKGELLVAGKFLDSGFENELSKNENWSKVNMLGYLNRKEINSVLNNSIAGLVTLHPLINYLDSLPVKMFEYMATGLPVIASNFPYWEKILEDNQCGICVDPLSPKSIAEAIDYIRNNSTAAKQMGINGRKSVEEKYNWSVEFKKLQKFYSELN